MTSLELEFLDTTEEILPTQDCEMAPEEFFKTKQAREMHQCMSEYSKKTKKAIKRYQEACKSREEMRSLRFSVGQVKQSRKNYQVFQSTECEKSVRTDQLALLKKEVQEIKDKFYRFKYAKALADAENLVLKDKIAKIDNRQEDNALCKCLIF